MSWTERLVSHLRVPALCLLSVLVLSGCASLAGGGDTRLNVPSSGTLTTGETLRDQLDRDEPINANNGSGYRIYQIDLEAEHFLFLQASSSDFTPTLALYGPDGSFLAGTGFDYYSTHASMPAQLSRLIVRPGTYSVVLSASEARQTGLFELTADMIPDDGELGFPGAVTSVLASGEDTFHPYTGAPMRSYPLNLAEEAHVEITLMSDDFDEYLSLINTETGVEVANSDAWGASRETRLRQRLDAGDYEIQVSGYSEDSNGRFTLRTGTYEPMASTPFELGSPHEGFLDTDRTTIGNRSRAGNAYEFTVDRDMVVDIEMLSDDVDAYLYLTDEDGQVIAEDDDSGQGLDSRLVIPLSAGTYTLWASSFSEFSRGEYRLLTEAHNAEDFTGSFIGDVVPSGSEPLSSTPIDAETLILGQTFNGDITPQRMDIPNTWSSGLPHEFTIDEPIVLDIRMMSDVVDAYLYVTDSNNTVVGEDDDSGTGLDARLLMPLEPGTYTVWATTYYDSDAGPYELATEVHDPAVFDGQFIGDYIYGDGDTASVSGCGCDGW